MSYDIIAVPAFRTELKRLSKKYPSLKSDVVQLSKSLGQDPVQGTPLRQKLLQNTFGYCFKR